MAGFDYLWWDNPQLHKEGGCRAASRGVRACVRALFCVYASMRASVLVCVRESEEGIGAPKDPFRANIVYQK